MNIRIIWQGRFSTLRELTVLKLLLPIIFSSWQFFSSRGPSPRIHYAFLQNENDEPQEWREFRPRPARVSFKDGLCRLLLVFIWLMRGYSV